MDKKHLWEASITSYFKYSTTVYQNIYNLFKKHHHLDEIFVYPFKNDLVKEKAIQHVSVAYMNNFDVDTVFQRIRSKDSKDILTIVEFIWQVYRGNEKYDEKLVLNLWETIFSLYKDEQSDESKHIFSSLSRWFVFIKDIDENNLDWFKMSARYAEVDYNSYFVIEELLRLVESNTHDVGKIFLEMLKEEQYPFYKEDNIIEIVESLFKNKEIENAKIICNKYSKKGIYFLNDIMRKYTND